MSRTNRFADKVAIVCCGALAVALAGCRTYVSQPHPGRATAAPPRVMVETSYVGIRTESDFYEPLSPYGRWEVVESYGRCWIPGHVDHEWRPYSDGYWQRTDAGWYWVSDEPWAWATYHYGRWNLSAQFGWYWVPQTQWAPAWVSWHQGAGYVGWAPLLPASRFGRSGAMEVNVTALSPRAYIFVEERQFLQPVRPTTVLVNNTTIINKTVNITNIKVVNNTVINEGPRTTAIEQVSGRKIQALPVRELRRQQEAKVAAKHRGATPTDERKGPPSARSAAESRQREAQLEAGRRAAEGERKAAAEAEQRRGEGQRAAEEAKQKQAQLEAGRRAAEGERKAAAEAEQRRGEGRRTAAEAKQKQAQLEVGRRAAEGEKKGQEVQPQPKGREKHGDDDLATSARVKRALAADPQLKDVSVEAAAGVVRLSGVVNTLAQKTMAGALANQADGVNGVRNEITVKE